jgi:tetratricopeptide (TPR) repeat protein
MDSFSSPIPRNPSNNNTNSQTGFRNKNEQIHSQNEQIHSQNEQIHSQNEKNEKSDLISPNFDPKNHFPFNPSFQSPILPQSHNMSSTTLHLGRRSTRVTRQFDLDDFENINSNKNKPNNLQNSQNTAQIPPSRSTTSNSHKNTNPAPQNSNNNTQTSFSQQDNNNTTQTNSQNEENSANFCSQNSEISLSELYELDHVAMTLRSQIHDQLLHNTDRNTTYLCELLINLQTARICDAYLYAYCLFKLGDYLLAINILRRFNLIFDLNNLLTLLPALNSSQLEQYQLQTEFKMKMGVDGMDGDDGMGSGEDNDGQYCWDKSNPQHNPSPSSLSLLNTSMGSLHIVHTLSITDFLSPHDILLCLLLYSRCLYELKRFSDLIQIIGPGFQPRSELPHTIYSIYDELHTYSLQVWGNANNPSYIVEIEQIWLMLYQFWFMGLTDFEILKISFLEPIFNVISLPLGYTQSEICINDINFQRTISGNRLESLTIPSTPLTPQNWRHTISQFSYLRAKISSQLQQDTKITCYYLSKTFFYTPTHLESFKTLVDCEFLPNSLLELFLLTIRSHYDLKSPHPIMFPLTQVNYIISKSSNLYLEQLSKGSDDIRENYPVFNSNNHSNNGYSNNSHGSSNNSHGSSNNHPNNSHRPANSHTRFPNKNTEQQILHDSYTFPYMDKPIPLTLHFNQDEIGAVSELIVHLKNRFLNKSGGKNEHKNAPKNPFSQNSHHSQDPPSISSIGVPNLNSPRIVQSLRVVHKVDSFNTAWLDGVCGSLIRSKSYIDIDSVHSNIDHINSNIRIIIADENCLDSERYRNKTNNNPKTPQKTPQTPQPPSFTQITSPNTLPPTPMVGILQYMSALEGNIIGTKGLGNSPLLLSALAESLFRQKRLGEAYNLTKHILYKLDSTSYDQMISQFPQYQRYSPLQQFVPLNLIYPNCAEIYALCCWELGKLDELFSLCSTLSQLIPNSATLWYCMTIYYLSSSQFTQAESLLLTNPILSLNSGVNTTFISNQLRLQRLLLFFHASHQQYDSAVAMAKKISYMFPLSSWEHVYLTKHYLSTINHKQIVFKAPFSITNPYKNKDFADKSSTGSNTELNSYLTYAYFNELSVLQLFSSQLCPCFDDILSGNLANYLKIDKDQMDNYTTASGFLDGNISTVNSHKPHLLSHALQSFTSGVVGGNLGKNKARFAKNSNNFNNSGRNNNNNDMSDDYNLSNQSNNTIKIYGHDQLLEQSDLISKPYSKILCFCGSNLLNKFEFYLKNLENDTINTIFFPQNETSPPNNPPESFKFFPNNSISAVDLAVISNIDPTLLYLLGLTLFYQKSYTPALYYFKKALLIYQISYPIEQCVSIPLKVPHLQRGTDGDAELGEENRNNGVNTNNHSTPLSSNLSRPTPLLTMVTMTYHLIPSTTLTALDEYESLLLNIAQCYRKLKQHKYAIIYYSLTMSLSTSPKITLECYIGIGMCYQVLGMATEAREYYLLALGLDTNNVLVQQLVTALSYTIVENVGNELENSLTTSTDANGQNNTPNKQHQPNDLSQNVSRPALSLSRVPIGNSSNPSGPISGFGALGSGGIGRNVADRFGGVSQAQTQSSRRTSNYHSTR